MELESQVTVSDRLADILDRMLLPAPSQRFQSAEAVIAALTPQNHRLPPVNPRLPSPQQQPHRHRQSLGDRHFYPGAISWGCFSGFEGGLIRACQSTATMGD